MNEMMAIQKDKSKGSMLSTRGYRPLDIKSVALLTDSLAIKGNTERPELRVSSFMTCFDGFDDMQYPCISYQIETGGQRN